MSFAHTILGICAQIFPAPSAPVLKPTAYQNMQVMERYVPAGEYFVDGKRVKIRYLRAFAHNGTFVVVTASVVIEIDGKSIAIEAPNRRDTWWETQAQLRIWEATGEPALYVWGQSSKDDKQIRLTTIRFELGDHNQLTHIELLQERSAFRSTINPEGVDRTRLTGQMAHAEPMLQAAQ